MSLVEPMTHLFLRLVKLTGFTLRFHVAHDLFEHFHRFETALAFVAFDVQFHVAVRSDGNFKFALWHKSSIPMPDLQANRVVRIRFLLDDDKPARAHFVQEFLINVLLHDASAQFFAEHA